MDIQRRLLLKGMVLGGISSLGFAKAGTGLTGDSIGFVKPMPILVLVNGRIGHSAFLEGVRAAAGRTDLLQVHDTDLGLDFLLALQHYIQSTQGRLIVGLVDDASATLIVDLARTAGARMHWLGQHAVGPGQSRHRLSDSRITGDYGTLFNGRLVAHGFDIDSGKQQTEKKRVTHESVSYVRNGTPDSQQWATDLGFILAGNGRHTAFSAIPQVSTGPASLAGYFVSFAFEI